MKKTLTLVLLITISYLLKAQTPPADLVAWTGEGENYSILVIDFNDSTKASSAVMWGYRYDSDSIIAEEMIQAVIASDPKLSGDLLPFASDIYYKELKGETPEDFAFYWGTYTKSENTAWFSNNGGSSKLGNGQYFAYSFVQYTNQNISDAPVSADMLPAERSLNTNTDISQWIGEGKNEAVLVVDFGLEETPSSYAWGIRFDSDSITGQEILDIVIARDSNFSGSVNGYIAEINYKSFTDFPIDEYWLSFTSDGNYTWGSNLGNTTKIGNGQWFGAEFTDDYLTATGPRPALTAIVPFSGGTTVVVEENKPTVTGISYDSTAIVAWATGITLKRGYLNAQDTLVTDKGTNKASFGIADNALGAAGTDATKVVSLGDAGEAILTFEHPIMNGEGADFAVFENGFDVTFLELAFVEVSSDGINYVRFPTRSEIQDTMQIGSFDPINPSKLYGFAGMHKIGLGSPFDLEILSGSVGLDLNAITHVKIVDVIGAIAGNPVSMDSEGNLVNDPFPTEFASGGFDLDGVGVIHQNLTTGLIQRSGISFSAYPNPVSSGVVSFSKELHSVQLFDAIGNEVMHQTKALELTVSNLKPGIYVVKAEEGILKIILQ